MNEYKPWGTFIALYAFAACLGGLIVFFFLVIVGAVNRIDLSPNSMSLADIAGPLISAVGIVVTALIAYSGWMRQQDELKAQREEKLQQRRNMAKVDRIPLAHILNEIIDVCRSRDDALVSVKDAILTECRRVNRAELTELDWPLDLVDRIQNVARYQEDPFLQSLLSLVQDMQVKKARSHSYDRKICMDYDGDITAIGSSGADYYKEVFELYVVWARCLALFDVARSRTDDTKENSFSPSEEKFWGVVNLTSRVVDQRFCREARMLLHFNGGVCI
ncbi:hypothetical protein [Thalassospira sp. MBR-102]|uniref:hypothetical protein n=1 Tax=Thalassospira sp. MBR-102 TaxID=3156466 RepID=UPI0033920FE1